MIYRRIADSILSHKRIHKSIKGLDKVASRHIIACRLSPVACRLSPVACRLSPVADHTQNTTTQLSSRMASVPKGFSLSGTLFYFSSYLYERRITMKKSNSTKKALGSFKKLGAVALITADTTVSMSFEPNPVEGGAVLILSPNKLTFKVNANTEDGSDITVEGCTETRLASDTKTTLHARGTTVILKGKITELDVSGTYENKQTLTALNVQGLTALQKLECWKNQLTELNVQGCAALQKLGCYSNQLNAQTMTEILNALPTRTAGDDARAWLYTEETDKPEGNYKDFTQPAELKAALDGAKKRNWKLEKINESGILKDI